MPKRSSVNVKGKQVSIDDVVGRDKISTTNITNIEASAPLPLSLHQLPSPPHDFTGREAELTELLSHVETGAVISGLRGQGGIGKTALALKLAEQLAPRYPDAQFYLDLKGVSDKPLTPAEALAHVIRAYHPTAKLPESEAELRGLYLSVLHDKRALLLMDNATDAAQVTPLIPPATCYLLITSRQHFHLPGLFAKDLEQMQPDEARELLLNIAQRIGEHADTIAKLCGYLPLALRLTASALAERRDLSPADLIRKLSDAQTRLKLTGTDASLQLSYDLLTTDLQKLWRALAVFPDTFDRAAAAVVWAMEEDAAHEALGELVKYSLLDFDPHPIPPPAGGRESLDQESPSPSGRGDGGEGEHPGRYRLHDLARLYADSCLSKSERAAAQQRHAQHYEQVLSNTSQLYMQGSESMMHGLALFDLEEKNIEAGQAWAESNTEKNTLATQLCLNYPNSGIYVLRLRQHPREGIRWLESALTAARLLKNRGAEGAHLGNLGLAYAALGETRKAIEFYKQHLTIAREIGDWRGEEGAQGNLGLAYTYLGETRKAIECYEQCLTIAREISDRRSEGSALGNLGIAYAVLGKTRKAIECYEQSLVIKREIGDQLGEGNTLGNLGLAYATLGEHRKAIEFYERQLTITRKISAQRGEGNALGNLGLAYAALGETHKAMAYYEQTLLIFREISDQRGEANALMNTGNAYDNLGESRQAIDFHEQALPIFREIGDRRGEGNALFNKSLALNKLGERAKAIVHAEAALKIYEQIEDPNTEKARKQLENWHKLAGKKWWQFWK